MEFVRCSDCGRDVLAPTREPLPPGTYVRCGACDVARFGMIGRGCDICYSRDPECPACSGVVPLPDDWNGRPASLELARRAASR
jgi:hypothetical protein